MDDLCWGSREPGSKEGRWDMGEGKGSARWGSGDSLPMEGDETVATATWPPGTQSRLLPCQCNHLPPGPVQLPTPLPRSPRDAGKGEARR